MEGKDGDAAGALDEDGCAGLEVAGGERVPGGDGGAGEGGGFLKAEVFGDGDDAGFLEEDEIGQHAIDVAAEGSFGAGGGERAVEPILHENAGDAVTGFPGGDAGADGDHLTGAVGAGNAGQAHFGVVEAFDHHQIAKIQGNCAYADEDFAGAGGGCGTLHKIQRIKAEGRDLPGAHG